MTSEGNYDANTLNEVFMPSGGRTDEAGGSAGEIFTRIELDLAYSSEKVLNLDMLRMHVSSRVSDYEVVSLDNDTITIDSMEKAFELDILSGILSSEVKEIDCFMSFLQKEIADARLRISSRSDLEISSEEIEEKLHDAKESLKQSQDQVSEIRVQSEKFEMALSLGGKESCNGLTELSESGHTSFPAVHWKTQTEQQIRHTLQMLEKSLAREIDLEKKLSDARHNEEEIKLKAHYADHETYCIEEAMEAVLERLFEAENAAVVLMGISKELMGKLHVVQFNLNSSIQRETEMRYKFEQSVLKLSAEGSAMQKRENSSADITVLIEQANDLKASLKEAENKTTIANSDAVILREKVNSLERQLTECNNQFQQAKASIEASKEKKNMLMAELTDRENVIEDLKENNYRSECRAESAEAQCTSLVETNLELKKELGFLKGDGVEKARLLERKLEECDAELEHAKASVEVIELKQSMLYSVLGDMENLIEDLKTKVSIAENRAESAESRCTILTETNSELCEELGFLRTRLECLEKSLNQADDAKVTTAKDIGIRTKIITALVMKLAVERERLQMQIFSLSKENKISAEKCGKANDAGNNFTSHIDKEREKEFTSHKSSEAVNGSSRTEFKVENSATADQDPTDSMDNGTTAEPPKPVRTIAAAQLSSIHVAMAVLILFISVLGLYLSQLESRHV